MTVAQTDGAVVEVGEWDDWTDQPSRPVRCLVRLEQDQDGGFCAYLPSLPGVVSEGDSIKESLERINEALVAVIAEYRGKIPWQKTGECPPGEIERWIVVNA